MCDLVCKKGFFLLFIKLKKKEKNNDQEFVFNNSYSEQVKDFSQIGNKLIQNSHEVWNMSV